MTLTLLAPAQEAIEASDDAPLSQEQKRLIRDSFTRIEPASDLVARLFYMKSVDLDPDLRTLFKSPSRAQRRKFMTAMKVAVISLDRLQSLKPVLKLLGARHRQDGVEQSHYATFRRAWVWTLEQSLEARFPREASEAWTALFTKMTRATAS
jgi:hemoglobin-like flavoprotein